MTVLTSFHGVLQSQAPEETRPREASSLSRIAPAEQPAKKRQGIFEGWRKMCPYSHDCVSFRDEPCDTETPKTHVLNEPQALPNFVFRSCDTVLSLVPVRKATRAYPKILTCTRNYAQDVRITHKV